MKRLNRDGPPLLGKHHTVPQLDAAEFDNLLQSGTLVVDTRTAVAFGKEHAAGTINIPYNKSFTNWAGWIIPYEKDFALIVDDRTDVRDVARDLAMIGLDRVKGYFTSNVLKGRTDLQKTAHINTAEMDSLAKSGDAIVIDVRNSNERAAGHIPGTQHVHLGYLADVAAGLPNDKPIAVHCQGGGRAAIAASLLQAAGVKNVMSVQGGYTEWARNHETK